MRLRHRRLGAIDDVGDERGAVRQGDVTAVDVARLLLIDEKQVTFPGPAGDVDVLAHLDEPVSAENRQPAVAPGRQAVRREPIHADVAGAGVAAQHDVAEILEGRILRVVDVADLRRHDVGAGRAGEVQELIGLVRCDVAEDAAELRLVEEPRRPRLHVDAVRAEADGLDDLADRAGLDELRGLDRRAILEALAVHDRVDAAGLGLDADAPRPVARAW